MLACRGQEPPKQLRYMGRKMGSQAFFLLQGSLVMNTVGNMLGTPRCWHAPQHWEEPMLVAFGLGLSLSSLFTHCVARLNVQTQKSSELIFALVSQVRFEVLDSPYWSIHACSKQSKIERCRCNPKYAVILLPCSMHFQTALHGKIDHGSDFLIVTEHSMVPYSYYSNWTNLYLAT